MAKRTHHMIIATSSDIVFTGLAALLNKKHAKRLKIEHARSTNDLARDLSIHKPDVVIIDPTWFERVEKDIRTYRQSQTLKLIGLITSYHHPSALNAFDVLIYIDDAEARIVQVLEDMLEKAEVVTAQDDSLTKREREILRLVVSGQTSKEISEKLFISTHTVHAHRKNIMRKLDIKTMSGLTIYAVLNNIITLTEA